MPSVDLFLGGFGTGSNRIMATLDANTALLAKADITVPKSAVVRDGFTNLGHRIGDALDRRGTKPDPADIAALTTWIAQQKSKAPKRLLLADSEMIGIARHLTWQGLLYHRKNTFFQALRAAWSEGPATVYVGTRSYDALFSRAWCAYTETGGNGSVVPPTKTPTAVMRRGPSWVSFAKSLADTLPQTEIVMWQADNPEHSNSIAFEAMFGSKVAKALKPPSKKTPCPVPMSQKAFEIFAAIYSDSGEQRARYEWNNIREVYDPRHPNEPLSLFSANDRAKLAAQYDEDCRTLASLGGQIRFIGPREKVSA